MKYVIEIEDEPFGRNDDPVIPHGLDELYKAKGFNALVFDKNGLDKLIPLKNELEEAYQKGYDEARLIYQNPNAESDYQKGLNYMWDAAKKISLMSPDEIEKVFPGAAKYNRYNLGYSGTEAIEKLKAYEQKKAESEIKVSDIITDGKINYLVTDITDKSYIALQGTDFEPVYIGKDYIKYYHNLHDPKDMTKIAEEINKAMKGEQRDCHTCKHPSSIECVDCRSFGRWQPKEGAE